MAGIRVNTSVKRIEVNDNGDYITLNFSDSSFPDRFCAMLENFQNRVTDVQAQEAEIKEKFAGNDEALIRNTAALYRQFNEGIMEEVDTLFGQDTCRKVFGDIVPGIELFDDFVNQLMPYFDDYAKDRAEKLSKYSAARTGNV